MVLTCHSPLASPVPIADMTWQQRVAQHMKVAQKQLIIVAAPVFLSPLLMLDPKKELQCAFVVLLMGLYWLTEVVPLAVTALLPMILYPALGIMNAHDVSGLYFSDANFVFFGSLVMAVAIERCNLHERIALRIILCTGSNPRRLMLGFQVAAAILSMWISNTATTAMMVPIAMAVFRELHQHQFLAKEPSSAELPSLMVERHPDPDQQNEDGTASIASSADGPSTTLTELAVGNIPEAELKVYKGILLCICYSATIGGTGTLIGTGPNLVMSGELEEIYGPNTGLNFVTWMAFVLPQCLINLLACWLWLQLVYIGTRRSTPIGGSDDIVLKVLRKKYSLLGSMRFEERLVMAMFLLLVSLWLLRDPHVIPGWSSLFQPGYMTDGVTSMIVAFLLFVLPRHNPMMWRSKHRYSTLMNWDIMQQKFSWSTIILLGGGYAMAAGVRASGLSTMLGHQLAAMTILPQWAFLTFSIVLIAFITEFSSNVAAASIFVPLVTGVAEETGTNPLYFVLPVALACSLAFMLPAGTPPNAIVFSSKMMHVMDMVKVGVVMKLFSIAVAIVFTHTWGWYLFDMGTYPHWATRNATIQIEADWHSH